MRNLIYTLGSSIVRKTKKRKMEMPHAKATCRLSENAWKEASMPSIFKPENRTGILGRHFSNTKKIRRSLGNTLNFKTKGTLKGIKNREKGMISLNMAWSQKIGKIVFHIFKIELWSFSLFVFVHNNLRGILDIWVICFAIVPNFTHILPKFCPGAEIPMN